jgi:hypothetical protein
MLAKSGLIVNNSQQLVQALKEPLLCTRGGILCGQPLGSGPANLPSRGFDKQALRLPQGGKGKPRSPVAWSAAFVLSGDWR